MEARWDAFAGHRLSFIVSRYGMPDACASAFERETQRRDEAPQRGPTPLVSAVQQNPRNGIVEDSVTGTVVSNLRPQRCRGVPQARPSRPPGGYPFGKKGQSYNENQRNGIVEICSVVFKTVGSNVRPQRCGARAAGPPFPAAVFIRSQEPARRSLPPLETRD